MTYREVVVKYFNEFKGMVRNPDISIENGNTMEDIFQSAILTSLKKYRPDELVDESEAYNYIRKTILSEFIFCYKRVKKDMLVLCDSLPDIPYSDPNLT